MRRILYLSLLFSLLTFPCEAKTPWTSKPPVGATINWGHPLSKGLVGVWLMNERGGAILRNLADNKNTIAQPSLANKWTPYGLNNTGVDGSYATIPTGVYERWFNFTIIFKTKAELNSRNVFNFQPGAGTPIIQLTTGASVFGGNADKFTLGFRNASGSGFVSSATTVVGTATRNVWVVTRDGSAGVVNWYLNGKLDVSASGKTTGLIDTGTEGALLFDTPQSYRGEHEYLIIYNRALSPPEIQQLYKEPYCFIQPQTNWDIIKSAISGLLPTWDFPQLINVE